MWNFKYGRLKKILDNNSIMYLYDNFFRSNTLKASIVINENLFPEGIPNVPKDIKKLIKDFLKLIIDGLIEKNILQIYKINDIYFRLLTDIKNINNTENIYSPKEKVRKYIKTIYLKYIKYFEINMNNEIPSNLKNIKYENIYLYENNTENNTNKIENKIKKFIKLLIDSIKKYSSYTENDIIQDRNKITNEKNLLFSELIKIISNDKKKGEKNDKKKDEKYKDIYKFIKKFYIKYLNYTQKYIEKKNIEKKSVVTFNPSVMSIRYKNKNINSQNKLTLNNKKNNNKKVPMLNKDEIKIIKKEIQNEIIEEVRENIKKQIELIKLCENNPENLKCKKNKRIVSTNVEQYIRNFIKDKKLTNEENLTKIVNEIINNCKNLNILRNPYYIKLLTNKNFSKNLLNRIKSMEKNRTVNGSEIYNLLKRGIKNNNNNNNNGSIS